MPKKENNSSVNTDKRLRPALTPETREQQLVSLAMNLAEKQLLDGTASSTVITHYLKLGTMQAKLENEKLRAENELLHAKIDSLQSSKNVEDLYREAINAFRDYSGRGGDDEDEDLFEDDKY